MEQRKWGAVVTRLPLAYDMEIYCGASFEQQFRWLPDGQAPQDFTGWTANMRVGRISGSRLFGLSTDTGEITLTASGQIIVYLPPGITSTFRAGTFSYFLTLTDGNGRTIPFLRGRCEIYADIGPAL